MFRQIAATLPNPPDLLGEPTGVLAARLEALWTVRARAGGVPWYATIPAAGRLGTWDHLIYAYMIENTRAPEIVRRLLVAVTQDERLSVPRNPVTYTWLRSTEELFYSYGPPLFALSTVSRLRPDPGATRRNAYYRMFGMDLNHGNDDGSPFAYHRADVANRDFVATLETFLRETWRAIENARNLVGANPTDEAAVADLALRLQTMLNERRGGSAVAPNLAREEFEAVAAMSWLHLLVSFDNDVLADFQASGTSSEDRLGRLAARVGLPAHAHGHSYFILGPLLSLLLTEIEVGLYSLPAGARALWVPPMNPLADRMRQIVDHWSRATGRNLKSTPVTPTLARPTGAAAPGAPATNGRARISRETLEV